MSSYLNEFEICAKIPQHLRNNIKLFHVFNDLENKKNMIFVTKEDNVYGLGNNSCGVLGLAHDDPVDVCTEIKELSNQMIKELITRNSFVLGVNENNELFGWGENKHGQLGRGYISDANVYLRPDKIVLPDNITVKDISCGDNHVMILSSNGDLYGWGDNSEGQLSLGWIRCVIKPERIKINNSDNIKFEYIYCSSLSSFARAFSGDLLSWGFNTFQILGHPGREVDSVFDLTEHGIQIRKMRSNMFNSYFLSKYGSIICLGSPNTSYLTGYNYRVVSISKTFENIFELSTSIFCCDCDGSYFQLINGNLKPVNIECETFAELCIKKYGITPKMCHVDLGIKYFRLLDKISSGGFGTVGKYVNIFDEAVYAIKKIENTKLQNLHQESIMREVKTMAKLESHLVVRYKNSWIENNCHFIQMEYCFDNLRNILKLKPQVFERIANQVMNSIEYYISCEIFRQITEALNYLHSLKPEPLIHRDLKPENILIGKHNNKLICKLADFGLSKFIEDHSDYHTMVGATHKYRAPEIASGHKYDTKVDIWSLGIIGLEIFDIEKSIDQYKDESFSFSKLFGLDIVTKLQKFDKLISYKLVNVRRDHRISCDELLIEIKRLNISRNSLSKTELDKYFEKKLNRIKY